MSTFILARQRAEAAFKPAPTTGSKPSVLDEVADQAARVQAKTARLRAQRLALAAASPTPSPFRKR